MTRSIPLVLAMALMLTGFSAAFSSLAKGDDSAGVRAQFAQPPRQYSSGPLWVWNDLLTETQIRSTLRDLSGQHVRQVWVHPRPGLMTPYLGEDWFRLWKVALDEAERLDMNVWIYDENSYPSGFAGGLVPEAMPESRGQGLHFSESDQPGKVADDLVAAYRLTEDGCENVTAPVRAGQSLPAGRYLTASLRLAPTSGWFGGKYYVDLLRPGVTEKFIEITLDAYRREIGQQFGRRVPGVFTDEPHLAPAGGLHWGDYLADDFSQRWDYDLMQHLPSLVRPVGDWRKVRHNYHQLLLEKFIERWAKPCYEYCEKNQLEFTGHYWEHGWPGASHGPDNMAMYAWHQRPAIDNLMNQYSTDVHGQFGNARTVRELASVANQLGRRRTLCEAYGAGGWDLRFEDMKRIGDWLYVLGVNTLNQHLSYVTIRGARKRDHPQSFSYHTPWWQDYQGQADYFARLSLALSSGEQVHRVLLLEPTTSAWMYQSDKSTRKELDSLGNTFQEMVNRLEAAQVEYDMGCEDIMARHARIDGARINGARVDEGRIDEGRVGEDNGNRNSTVRGPVRLVVGRRAYDLVVLPPRTENLNSPTMRLLEEYTAAGGLLLACCVPPQRVDGQVSDRGVKLATASGWRQLSQSDAIDAMQQQACAGLTIRRAEGDRGLLFHHRRRLDDGQFLFLVNTSIDQHSTGTLESRAHDVRQWDLERGTVGSYPFVADQNGVQLEYDLPPCGSLLLFLADAPGPSVAETSTTTATVQPLGPVTLRPLEPNVLTLDFVDVTVGDETLKNAYFYQAQQFVFARNGMPRNPWDSAVQFRDELITRKFPPQSGFQAVYRFTIDQQVPEHLQLVVERPDLYAVACNGQPVMAQPGQWWLDKSFGRIDLGRAAKVGENRVTLTARPMTIYHELESVYVLGDFSLQPATAGYTIGPPQPLQIQPRETGGWNRQGYPFYATGVAYTEQFDLPEPQGSYRVSLPDWYGSVARVIVNGKVAGRIAHAPWECEVTNSIQPGRNTIEVVVVGTLKNTLGPHHAGHMVGKAWPSAFQQGPKTGPPAGPQYDTLGYGLFEPFVLIQQENRDVKGGR